MIFCSHFLAIYNRGGKEGGEVREGGRKGGRKVREEKRVRVVCINLWVTRLEIRKNEK